MNKNSYKISALITLILLLVIFFMSRVRSEKKAVANKETRPIAINNLEQEHPGYVQLTKTATTTSRKNVWRIQYTVGGLGKAVPSDIVVLLDTSSSMLSVARPFRIKGAKTAIKTIIEQMWSGAPSSGATRLSIVAFDWAGPANQTYPKTGGGFGRYPNPSTLIRTQNLWSSIEGFAQLAPMKSFSNENKQDYLDMTSGLQNSNFAAGTPTADAINKAREILKNSKDTKKTIIIISDGYPQNMGKNYFDNSMLVNYTPLSFIGETAADLADFEYFSEQSFDTEAIAQSILAKKEGIKIYTLGLSPTEDGNLATTGGRFDDLEKWAAATLGISIPEFYNWYEKESGYKPALDPMWGYNNVSLYPDEMLKFMASLPTSNSTSNDKNKNTYQIFENTPNVQSDISKFVSNIAEDLKSGATGGKVTIVPADVTKFFKWENEPIAQTYYSNSKNTPKVPYSFVNDTLIWNIDVFAPVENPDKLVYYLALPDGYDKVNAIEWLAGSAHIEYVNYNGQNAIKFFPEIFANPDPPLPSPDEFYEEWSPINYKPKKESTGFNPPKIKSEKKPKNKTKEMVENEKKQTLEDLEKKSPLSVLITPQPTQQPSLKPKS